MTDITYRHSGGFGDIIYSLAVLPKLPRGKFLLAMHNIANVTREYGYNVDTIHPYHRERLKHEDFVLMKPLLERQPYIESVGKWFTGDPLPTYNLDEFRKIAWFDPATVGFLAWFHKAVNLPYDINEEVKPWLHCDPKPVAKIIVARTARYLDQTNGLKLHKMLYEKGDHKNNAMFIGTAEEHQAYEVQVGPITRYEVADYLDMMNVIAGANLFVGNQTFAYALAVGTGVPTILETRKDLPLARNECYFQRKHASYY